MRRVLFLITDLAYGGAEDQVVRLAVHLKTRGWDVAVTTMLSPSAYMQELESAGVPLVSLDIRRGRVPDPRAVTRLAGATRRWRPDIVHSHMVHANLLARLTRPLARVPVLVCTAHSIDERGPRGSGRARLWAYRLTDPFCDLTTQVSRAGARRYVELGAVPKRKIRYVANGLDTSAFAPAPESGRAIRMELGLDELFVWLAVGNLREAKDYPSLLHAFAEAVKTGSPSTLMIAGKGAAQGRLERLTRDLAVDDRVRFLGLRRDVPKLMNAADGYVLSSLWEGLPMVLLEAAATGLPIVATDVGGNGEVVLDGQSGFLVPPRDTQALTQAMLKLMALPEEERRRMGRLGRAHVMTHFAIEQVVDQWEALYVELLAQRGPRT